MEALAATELGVMGKNDVRAKDTSRVRPDNYGGTPMFKHSTAQATGRAGERWFQFLLPKEWIFDPPREDVGLDGRVIIIDDNRHISGHEFDVQIKTSKEWKITNGQIRLDGLKLSTLKFWGARLTPVLLVLYDESRDTGYFSWIKDTWDSRNPITYLRSRNKTIGLSIDSRSVLSKSSWDSIKKDVFKYYLRIVTSYEKLNFIPNINTLTTCLWHLLEAFAVQPQDETEKQQNAITVLTSYKLLLDTLQGIHDMYSFVSESDFSGKVISFHKEIQTQAQAVFPSFGDIARQQQPPATVVMNDEAFSSNTGWVILRVLNFLMEITKRDGILDEYFTRGADQWGSTGTD